MGKLQASPWVTYLVISRSPCPLTHHHHQHPPLAGAVWPQAKAHCRQRQVGVQHPVFQVPLVVLQAQMLLLVRLAFQLLLEILVLKVLQAFPMPQALQGLRVPQVFQAILVHLAVLAALAIQILQVSPIRQAHLGLLAYLVPQVVLLARTAMVVLHLVRSLHPPHQQMEDRVPPLSRESPRLAQAPIRHLITPAAVP